LQITKDAVFNGLRTGWVRKRFLEEDVLENVVSSWTIKKTYFQTGRLMLVSTDFIFSYVSKCLVYDFQKQEQVAVEYTFYTDINTV